MTSALSASYALSFLLPILSVLCISWCKFTRQNLAIIIGIMVMGLLGVVEAILGILGIVHGAAISSAVLDGFSGLTANALLTISIYRSNCNRESPIVPTMNLAAYALSLAVFVLCGTVLSLLPTHRSPSSILGPLFHLLFATAALPLLVYALLATMSTSTLSDDDLPTPEEIIPHIPTTPRKFQSHFNLPLSPSFLSLSSPPPSPSSHRTFSSSIYLETPSAPTRTKCVSLDLPARVHSIRLKSGRDANVARTAKKCSVRPATAPISSREKKTRPRPAPLNFSLQVGRDAGSQRALLLRPNAFTQDSPSLSHGTHQSATLKKPSVILGDSTTSPSNRVWSFLLIAQVAAVLSESLRICIEVALTGSGQDPGSPSTNQPVVKGVIVLEVLANVFLAVQVACVMGALISYKHFFPCISAPKDATSVDIDLSSKVLFPSSSTNLNLGISVSDEYYSGPPTASTLRTDSFPTSIPLPMTKLIADPRREDLDQLDRDLREMSKVLNMELDWETGLEALDLALPLTSKSDSSLEQITSPLQFSVRTKKVPNKPRIVSTQSAGSSNQIPCRSVTVSVHEATDVDVLPYGSSMARNKDRLNLESHLLIGNGLGFSSSSTVKVAAEAYQSKSTVAFPTFTSDQPEEVKVRAGEGHSYPMDHIPLVVGSQSQQSSPTKSRRSAQNFGIRNAKHGRLSSIPSFSSFSSSIAKSRLRSLSFSGKGVRRSFSTATASIMDWGSERNMREEGNGTLSRSSSFCSPRPKRRALPVQEEDVAFAADFSIQDEIDLGLETKISDFEYHVPRTRPESPENRTSSPVPFASYASESTSPIVSQLPSSSFDSAIVNDEDPASSTGSKPPPRPSRSSALHIFPNFDALAGLGSLGAKLSRGLNRSRSPTPTRVLSPGAGADVVGLRSPTPKRMVRIMTTVTGGLRSPSRLGLDLRRAEVLASEGEQDEGNDILRDEDDRGSYRRGWRCADMEDEQLFTSNIELSSLRTSKTSKISGLKKIPIPKTPGSLSSDTSDTETTADLQTPRTFFTPSAPTSPLHSFYPSPQSLADPASIQISRSRSSLPLCSNQLGYRPTSPVPPSSFNNSRFISNKGSFRSPLEVYDDNEDPFAGPEPGAIVRESQVNLLRENSDEYRYDQIQTATRMSAWGNLMLPVPKEKRNPGVGLRRVLSDHQIDAAATFSLPDSLSTYSRETVLEPEAREHLREVSEVVVANQVTHRNFSSHRHPLDDKRDSHGSISLVPVEEALLAQRLLRRLNRKAEARDYPAAKPKKGSNNDLEHRGHRNENIMQGQNSPAANARTNNVSGNTSTAGRSFLLDMAKGKFLGYGWTS
ncbi:hypothetical protein GYMLUDRAFT_67778 [Collybiopsis luxurians FD-317 M1]|nr:hypothetical protein GYMLUDRAFT_67778 [Collybiopsis luxurians FD-317 M1]